MSINRHSVIRCDECHYEDPNDYYFGIRKWIFIDDLEEDKTLHFCSENCLNYYSKSSNIIFTNRRDISNDSKEFKDIILQINDY